MDQHRSRYRKVFRANNLSESGRQDLNLRPSGPKPDALAKLSYAPGTKTGLEVKINRRWGGVNSRSGLTLVHWFAVGTRWWTLWELKTAGIWRLCVSCCPFFKRSPPRLAGGGRSAEADHVEAPSGRLHHASGRRCTPSITRRTPNHSSETTVVGLQSPNRGPRSPNHEARTTKPDPRSPSDGRGTTVPGPRSPVSGPRSRNHDPRTPIPDQSGRPPS